MTPNLSSPDIADMFRGVSLLFFLALIFQVVYVLVYYGRVLRIEHAIGQPKSGLLPTHVLVLGVALIGYAGTLTWLTINATGSPLTWVTVIIAVLNGFTTWGIRIVMAFEYRRYEHVVDLRDSAA